MTSKVIYKFGINDADYPVQKFEVSPGNYGKPTRRQVWECPFYAKWRSMLRRVYSKFEHDRNPTYTDCTVCNEWLRFTNFKAWMETQDWEGKELDKDLLFHGNKVYDPSFCIFIDGAVNNFIIEREASRGEWPIGVYWNTYHKKFRANCANPFIGKQEHLGYFSSATEAHQAWLKRKLELAKLLAAEQDDPRVAKALVERYENYQK